MVNYQNSKIYRIWSDKGPKQYIGGTTQSILRRFADHKRRYIQKDEDRKTTAYELFDEYGVENCYIELIENYPCNSKIESNIRESYYIKLYKLQQTAVNRQTPYVTAEEAKERDKKYREDNKEERHEKAKQYREANNDKIKERDNKHYALHKEEIQAKRKVKINCGCGTTYSKNHKARHEKSIKHQNYISNRC